MDINLTPASAATDEMPNLIRAAHWLSALAIFAAFGVIWARKLFEDDAAPSITLLGLHRQLGLLVLSLWAVRLIVRWSQRRHLPDAALPTLLRWAASVSHIVLYTVLLAMPLLGWAMTNARGHAVSLLNTLVLPMLVATDPDLADTLQDWHEWGAWALIGLVLMHVAAALWHHWVRRDGVLASMLPLVRRRAGKF